MQIKVYDVTLQVNCPFCYNPVLVWLLVISPLSLDITHRQSRKRHPMLTANLFQCWFPVRELSLSHTQSKIFWISVDIAPWDQAEPSHADSQINRARGERSQQHMPLW